VVPEHRRANRVRECGIDGRGRSRPTISLRFLPIDGRFKKTQRLASRFKGRNPTATQPCVAGRPASSRCTRSTARSTGSCSQIRSTRHPDARRAALLRASRSALRASFIDQDPPLVRRRVACSGPDARSIHRQKLLGPHVSRRWRAALSDDNKPKSGGNPHLSRVLPAQRSLLRGAAPKHAPTALAGG
jgi:hypothetical protein